MHTVLPSYVCVCVFRLYRHEEHLNEAIDRKEISIRVQYNTKRNIRIKLCSWWNSLKWEFDESKQMLWWHKKFVLWKMTSILNNEMPTVLPKIWLIHELWIDSDFRWIHLLFHLSSLFFPNSIWNWWDDNKLFFHQLYKHTYNRQRGFRHKKYWVRRVCDEP